jgi:hypothetical protein
MSLWVLGLTAAACMDVLGIPGDPRLVEDSPSAVVGTSGPDAAAPPSTEPAATGQITPGTGEAPPTPASPPEPSSEAPVPGAEPSDAGLPAPGLADAAGSLEACGVSGSVGPNARCFAVLQALQSWDDARASCRALGQGWDLASIRSAEVDEFVAGLITAEAWIGASDSALEKTWIWANDGLAFWRGNAPDGGALGGAYANWNSTEPNGGNNTNCARIVPAVGATWADLECEILVGALCEGPLL